MFYRLTSAGTRESRNRFFRERVVQVWGLAKTVPFHVVVGRPHLWSRGRKRGGAGLVLRVGREKLEKTHPATAALLLEERCPYLKT